MKKNDQYRANMERNSAAAASGGPDYRKTGTGKGDVNRTRNRTKFDLGMDLIRIAEESGKDSKEYAKALKAWRNAK